MRDQKDAHLIILALLYTSNTLTLMQVGDTADVPGGDVLVEGFVYFGFSEHFDKRGRGDGVVEGERFRPADSTTRGRDEETQRKITREGNGGRVRKGE